MQAVNDQIEALGATLVGFTPQTPDKNLAMVEKNGLTFDLLHDKGNEYALQLGIRFIVPPKLKEVYQTRGLDLPGHNGDDSWSLPMPGRFVVDRTGIVRAVDVHPDYTRRPEPEKTLADLRAL